ncbi:MAG: AMP-binding protein [Pseudobdellovibrionaceae bacterium]
MESNQKIIWNNEDSAVLLNPRMPTEERHLLSQLPELYPQKSHIWISSSGSSTGIGESTKLIALSKQAFLASAQAVNQHLQSDSKDCWVQVLPQFHVGGLSIEARVHLSGAQQVNGLAGDKWDARFFHQTIEGKKGTLSALVPTQIIDLIQAKLKSPSSLRAVVVGGSALPGDIYTKALDLGWPLLPSYGMTECCSQVATAGLESLKNQKPELQILSHIQAQTNSEGYLKIQSPSLLTGFAQWKNKEPHWLDPKEGGWFQTQDLCEIQNGILKPLGRGSDYVKVLGEGVNLQRLQERLESLAHNLGSEIWRQIAIVAILDARRENQILLVHTVEVQEKEMDSLVKSFNEQVAPYEKIQGHRVLREIPRTALGKIAREKIKALILKEKP